MQIKIFKTEGWGDYELLDTGEGEKLERVGQYVFARPFPDAVWKKDPRVSEWKKLNGKFVPGKGGEKGRWAFAQGLTLREWGMEYRGVKFKVMPTPFRHFGFFPEQAAHWDFIEAKLREEEKKRKEPIKFLNLFGYTGVASLFALRTGAEVTHVDASSQSLTWAKENQKLTGMDNLPMRVIEDDAVKFLEREEKRGNKYDAIIMDPPKFGRGPKGEVWKIEEMLPKLLVQVKKVLSDKPIFVILTSYSIDSSALSLGYALSETMKSLGGSVEAGEMCIAEKSQGRMIPLANTAVWTKV